MYRLASLLFLISVTNGLQLPCDTNITYNEAINVPKMVGNWYEIERIPNSYQEGDCPSWTITATTTTNNTISRIDISIKEVVNGAVSSRDGNITMVGLGPFLATFSDGLLIPFVIVDTNYTDYAVLYSCIGNGNNSEVMAWKLSRNQAISSATETVLQEYTGLSKGNNWTVLSHTKSACNNAINIQIGPVISLIAGLLITLELFSLM